MNLIQKTIRRAVKVRHRAAIDVSLKSTRGHGNTRIFGIRFQELKKMSGRKSVTQNKMETPQMMAKIQIKIESEEDGDGDIMCDGQDTHTDIGSVEDGEGKGVLTQ